MPTARGKAPPKTKCLVCNHPDRHRIEMTRVAGVSLERTAAKFKLKRDSVWRHMRDHVDASARASYLSDIPLKELAERANAEDLKLLDYLALIRSAVIDQMLLAKSSNDGYRVAILAGRGVEVLCEIGKLTGELRSAGINITNNTIVLNSPIFYEFQNGLITCLGAYPEALAAVVTMIEDPSAKHAVPAAGGDRALVVA